MPSGHGQPNQPVKTLENLWWLEVTANHEEFVYKMLPQSVKDTLSKENAQKFSKFYSIFYNGDTSITKQEGFMWKICEHFNADFVRG